VSTDAAISDYSAPRVSRRDPRDVLIAPVISEKSYGLLDENKYTFLVRPDANKTQIKIAVDQLNAYDILVADEVVFTQSSLDTFVAGPVSGRSAKATARASEAGADVTTEPGTDELAAASVEGSAEPSNADLAASAASVAEVLEPTDDVTEGETK
jgi:ribosomal protein L23